MPSSLRTRVGRLTAIAAVVALSAACTSQVTPDGDPDRALQEALVTLADYPGTTLRLAFDRGLDPSDLVASGIDPAIADLLLAGEVELRSSSTEAAHARLAVGDDPAAREVAEAAFGGLAVLGLDRLGDELAVEGWIRVSTRPDPPSSDGDRIAVGLAGAADRLRERATAITHEGVDAGRDRLRVSADDDALARFVDEAVEVISFTAAGGEVEIPVEPSAPGSASGAGIDVWLEDGRVAAVGLDLRSVLGAGNGPPVPLRMELQELEAPSGLPEDALAFSLRGLARDLFSAVTSRAAGQDPAADTDDPSSPAAPGEPGAVDPGEPDPPTGQDPGEDPGEDAGEPAPDPLREGGVLDEAFGEDRPFEGGEEFECITEEELDLLEELLGPEAVMEVEELIDQGLLVRC